MRRMGQCARYPRSALGPISAVASEVIAVDLPAFALTGTRHSAGFNSRGGDAARVGLSRALWSLMALRRPATAGPRAYTLSRVTRCRRLPDVTGEWLDV